MGVFDGWEDWREGDFMGMQSVSLDLTTPDGFAALEQHAAHEVNALYGWNGDAWDTLAGRTLEDVARQLANDLMQESVSLPVGAFSDPQAAGRELAVVKQVATYVYLRTLREMVTQVITAGKALPSGRPHAPVALPTTQHKQRLQNHK